MEQHQKVTKRYIFTLKELKEKLGMEGEFRGFNLWSGRSPKMESDGVSPDEDQYYFIMEVKDKHFQKTDD
jgi:hypothetical protein